MGSLIVAYTLQLYLLEKGGTGSRTQWPLRAWYLQHSHPLPFYVSTTTAFFHHYLPSIPWIHTSFCFLNTHYIASVNPPRCSMAVSLHCAWLLMLSSVFLIALTFPLSSWPFLSFLACRPITPTVTTSLFLVINITNPTSFYLSC